VKRLAVILLLCSAVAGSAMESTEQLTPAAEQAVKKGVAWLSRNQLPSGGWQSKQGDTSGIAGACAIALMSQGHLPGTGDYGVNTALALRFILDSAQPDGLLYRSEFGIYPMYHHGLATLALAEAWGQTGDRRIREALRKAVDLICATQNQRGGWRYQPKIADDDLSVSVMQLMALRAAQDAGMDVPVEVITAGIEYVKFCHSPRGTGGEGGFGYTGPRDSGWARTGAGVTALQVAGDYRADEVIEGIEYLMRQFPVVEGGADAAKRGHWYYGAYYTTMGIYQAQSLGSQGKAWWNTFYPAMTRELLKRQKPDGAWGDERIAYETAMSVLVLTVPYRYLPIYQR
jgi:hypothetical protein